MDDFDSKRKQKLKEIGKIGYRVVMIAIDFFY